MGSKLEKFSNWTKLAKWKKIGNGFTELLGWIVFPISIIILILILIVACRNFFNINDFMHKGMTKETIEKGVFDSNVLTFMISFLLVFLGTILLNIEYRAKKQIDSAKETINQLRAERTAMPLLSRILVLWGLSINYQNALDLNKDDSIKLLNYRTHRMAESILKMLSNDTSISVTGEEKDFFNDFFGNMINDFDMDIVEDDADMYEDNTARVKFRKSIDETINVLRELQKEISRLRTV